MESRRIDERPPVVRPGILAASGAVLIAAVGLWIASLAAAELLPEGGVTAVNLMYYLPFVLLPVALCCLRRPGLSRAMRLGPVPVLPAINVCLLALATVYAASALTGLWGLALDALGLTAPEGYAAAETSGGLIRDVLAVAALPAVAEELLFRGFVLGAWESRGTAPAIAVSAGLFALMHGNLYGLPAYLLVGGLSGYLVYALDSVYAGIIFHTAYNAAVLTIQYLLAGAGEAEAAVTGGAVAAAAIQCLTVLAMMAAMVAAMEVRRRVSGIRPEPRARVPLTPPERWMTAACVAVMIVSMALVCVRQGGAA